MNTYLNAAIESARAAGELIRHNIGTSLTVNVEEAHDLKLALDVSAQDLITKMLLKQFPDHAVIGEEGSIGSAQAKHQWIVDPIDGTVNFFYGIPHFCISIALRETDKLVIGVIFDPIKDELWSVSRGEPAFPHCRIVRGGTQPASAPRTRGHGHRSIHDGRGDDDDTRAHEAARS